VPSPLTLLARGVGAFQAIDVRLSHELFGVVDDEGPGRRVSESVSPFTEARAISAAASGFVEASHSPKASRKSRASRVSPLRCTATTPELSTTQWYVHENPASAGAGLLRPKGDRFEEGIESESGSWPVKPRLFLARTVRCRPAITAGLPEAFGDGIAVTPKPGYEADVAPLTDLLNAEKGLPIRPADLGDVSPVG